MTYKGIVSNGKIVLEADARLPEGTVVNIMPVEEAASGLPGDSPPTRRVLTAVPLAANDRRADDIEQ